MKRLVRLIVTSATYRQSSAVTPATASPTIPENRLLARGPRFRLPAEFIRDQALAVSGLLDGRLGGPSVSPYQPAGLWEELMSRQDGDNWSAQKYTQSHGADLYRRTMYTFWKRTCPPPTLATFDAPDRETCTVRRSRTNTPLQALVLLNDPTYVEAARKLAERILPRRRRRRPTSGWRSPSASVHGPPAQRRRTGGADGASSTEQLADFRERCRTPPTSCLAIGEVAGRRAARRRRTGRLDDGGQRDPESRTKR